MSKIVDVSKHDINNSLRSYNNPYYKYLCNKVLIILCLILFPLVSHKLSLIYLWPSDYQFSKELSLQRKTYLIYPFKEKLRSNNSYLKHVHLVLQRLGYKQGTNETPWDLLWAHQYPFRELNLRKLSPEQRVCHFPAIGHITQKVYLATSINSKYIPKAFRLPKDKDKFKKYAKDNKNAMFVQKHNDHRYIHLKNVSDIDITSGKNFVQEYMQNPFLVDGHKFDVGVYVAITSLNPLRVYWYTGDILIRYCPEKYYPLDPLNYNKYVVGDRYLPTWEVPSLAHLHSALGFSMKESFDAYVRSVGKDPAHMWDDVLQGIQDVLYKAEHLIIPSLKNYSSTDNFFEMLRFDFIVDENLKAYLLEANMSPNLSSERLLPNQLLYEQILYNLFSITGIARDAIRRSVDIKQASATRAMVSAQKNIAVFSDECSTVCKVNCEVLELCKLCKTCLNPKFKKILLDAHTEALHRGDFRRLIPPSLTPVKNTSLEFVQQQIQGISLNNRLLHLWYQGKCNQDIKWCT